MAWSFRSPRRQNDDFEDEQNAITEELDSNGAEKNSEICEPDLLPDISMSQVKRWSSAPNVHEPPEIMSTAPSTSLVLRPIVKRPHCRASPYLRIRHDSTGDSGGSSPDMINKASKFPSRLQRLRTEDKIQKACDSDYANEKYVHTALQASAQWDEFSLTADSEADGQSSANDANTNTSTAGTQRKATTPNADGDRKRTKSLTEPVHIFTAFLPQAGSPSPSRGEKQCYSPSMQQIVRSVAFSPTPCSSPTRRLYQRSLSPIAVRPTSLKRKYDSDNECAAVNSPKRFITSGSGSVSVCSTPDRSNPPTVFPLPIKFGHSLSTSSLDSESDNSTMSSDVVPSGGSISFGVSPGPRLLVSGNEDELCSSSSTDPSAIEQSVT